MVSTTWRQTRISPGQTSAQQAILLSETGPKAAIIFTNDIAQMGDDADTSGVKRPHKAASDNMSTTDRYIDARLAGIESKLDARMEAMQKFTEQAEKRNQGLIDELKQDARQASKETQQAAKRTVLNTWMASLTTILGVGAILLASVTAFQSSVSAVQGTVAEQGAWLRDSVSRIEQRTEAQAAPRAEAESE